MKTVKNTFSDPLDRELADRLSPLRSPVPDGGFSQRVRSALPRRDISLWTLIAAVSAGAAMAVGIMGWEATGALYRHFIDFFVSVFQGEIPSEVSLAAIIAAVVALGFSIYALLDTDDYQTLESSGI